MPEASDTNKANTSAGTSTTTSTTWAADSDLSPAWLTIAVGLLVARWLMPAESTTSGTTLWLVGGWLLLASAWTLARLRSWPITPLRLDRIDLAVTLLVAPQLLSALLMIVTSDGNARTAANMSCEWIGLLVSFVLLRRWLARHADFDAVLRIALAVAIGVSMLGVWQHHVGYRTAIAEFDRLETELAIAHRVGNISTIRRIQSELVASGIPLDGPARILWEHRLRNSREPYGFFALANSLGGLLAPLLLTGFALWPAAIRRYRSDTQPTASLRAILPLVLYGLLLLLVAYCLLLTKSRTAWVGLATGGLVLVGNHLLRWLREAPRRILIATLAPLLLVIVALVTGGIDREVLTEAPKSLAYRLEYWEGSVRVISDRPLLGTGPGNFRQHYLAHKLEGSSEEIADPHNFVLEATANAGLLGLAGLLACVGLIIRRRPHYDPQTPNLSNNTTQQPRLMARLAGICGFALALTPGWLLGGAIDQRLLAVLLGSGLAWSCLPNIVLDPITRSRACLAALVALVVHMSGAGGFSRPALLALILLMVIGCRPLMPPKDDHATADSDQSLNPARVISVACGLAFVLVGVFGMLPVFAQTTAAQNATHALLEGRTATAASLLTDALQADQLDPATSRQLAQLRIGQAASDPTNDEFLDQAVTAANNTVRRDPHNWASAHNLARIYYLKWQSRPEPGLQQQIVRWGTTAIDRYPSNPRLHAWMAVTLDQIGLAQDARDQARTTLRLHTLLQQRGHVDKLLDKTRLTQMQNLIDTSQGSQPGKTPSQ